MTLPCHQIDADWELLVLGALDGERSAEMRAHVGSGCARCQDRLRAAVDVVGSIGATLDPVDPPAHVEARLQQRLRALEAERGVRANPPVRRGAGDLIVRLAAVAALVACAVLVWQDLGQRRELAALRERVARGPGIVAPAASGAAAPSVQPAPRPAAPATSSEPVARAAEREWALERSRLEAAVAQADAARTRAEAEAARWRAELTRVEETLAASAPPPAAVSPPVAVDPRRGDDGRREEVRRLAADVRRLESEARAATGRARDYQNALQLALDPGSRRVALRAVDGAAGGATASALLAADGRLLVTTRDLPPLASDKCYQLWIIRRDTPAVVSGGVLNDAASGRVVHIARVEGPADRVTAFAITDEPAGGSESSRGRKLLFGALP